ncbi:MAG TPA: serine/threonine-protein kinase, partial [Isosphaeraceae bacterium]|nr:serine/threonine-protein kinase [Isosphaeraceae bacterium]
MTVPDETLDWNEEPDRSRNDSGSSGGANSELVSILDRYLADLQAGRAPDRAQVLADHPELSDQLRSCLAGIDFIHRTTGVTGRDERPLETLGEFLIVREIGRGGMGVVYEAEQPSLRRRVALKVLRFGVVADEGAMQRFGREAETVARMHHTNIVPIFAVGSDQGIHYYAMQFIEGRNLADVLNEAQKTGAGLSPEDVATWGLQAAEALEYAHRRGVIHRDVKPSNLMLDEEGIVWLTDFGLAKRADEATLTIAGTLMGTPRYMSPEQAEALRHPVDHRTDIYSLGATLYELATGRPVFESSTPIGVIRHILADEPVPPRQVRPGLSRDLETVILTCLAKNPAARYASAQALADDLRAVLDSRPIEARRIGPIERATRWVKRQKRTMAVAGTAALAAVLLVGGLALAWNAYSRSRLANLSLTTTEPHLAAELVDSQTGDVQVPTVSLPTRQPLELPASEYRVRLSAPEKLTESYDVRLVAGESHSFNIGLNQESLFEPIESSPFQTLKPVEDGGKTDLVQLLPQQIRRIEGSTGRVLWEFDPPKRFHDPQTNSTIVPADS